MAWARHLAGACLAWCAGVALQLQQEALWSPWVYAGMGAAALVGAWGLLAMRALAAPPAMRSVTVLLTFTVLSFALTGGHALSRSQSIDPKLEGQDLEVVGMVQAMPQRQTAGWRFRFQIEQAWRVDAAGALHPVKLHTALPAQVSLGWYTWGSTVTSATSNATNSANNSDNSANNSDNSPAALQGAVTAGERWRMRVRLQAPHGHMNPRGFDFELWLWERAIGATGYVRTGAKDPAPVRLASTWSHPIERWRQAVRDRLLTHLSPDPGDLQTAKLTGVVAALVTGDQAAIERTDWDVFRTTGVAHLMSISGLHVTMFAWLASALVAWAWRKSALWGFNGALLWPAVHVGAVSGLLLAGFYALFSGWGIPAQRTLLMLVVVVVLKISARHWHGVLIWLVACAVVLAWDPWALLQPGFWLSFVAVGVLMAHNPEGHTDSPRAANSLGEAYLPQSPHSPYSPHEVPQAAPTWRSRGMWTVLVHRGGALAGGGAWGLQHAGALLRQQATITVALAPLTLLFFGQVSLVGLLANLLAIPWVTLVITPLAMLGVLWSGAWDLAVWALRPLSAVLSGLAAWPLASVSTAMPPWGLALLGLLGALGLVLRLPLSWKVMCLPLLWPVLFWSQPRPAVGTFELLAIDVGQGNAVLVRTASHSLLYDAGPRYSSETDAGQRLLVPLLSHMGERLDLLMLSHRDSDHTGGAAAVLGAQPQARLTSSLEDWHALHALRPAWTRCHAGQSWVWDGVLFEVLHPALGATGRKPNALSCVLRISHGDRAALLAGDIEAAQEQALVQAGLAPADVLLVPHHGSKTSSTPAFLQALRPRLALVQAGYRSRFGHPAPEVVERYRALGIRLVPSSHCGAATWHSAAPDLVQCERANRKRYWHHKLVP